MAVPLIMAGVGAGLGLLQNFIGQGKSQRQRIEEQYNTDAYGRLLRADEANQALSPMATARAQQQELSRGMGAAQGAALNAIAGGAGDFSNAQGQGIKGSQAAMAASAPYSQAMAGALGQAQQAQQQKIQQSESLGRSIADLSNQVSYVNDQNRNPMGNILQGILGGVNTATNIYGLLNQSNPTSAIQEAEDVGVDTAEGMGQQVAATTEQANTAANSMGSAAAQMGVGLPGKPMIWKYNPKRNNPLLNLEGML